MHYQYLAKQNEGIPFSGHICKIDRIYLRSSKKKKDFLKESILRYLLIHPSLCRHQPGQLSGENEVPNMKSRLQGAI